MHSDFYLPNSVVRVHYQAMDGISFGLFLFWLWIRVELHSVLWIVFILQGDVCIGQKFGWAPGPSLCVDQPGAFRGRKFSSASPRSLQILLCVVVYINANLLDLFCKESQTLVVLSETFALQTYMHCSWVYYKKQTNKKVTDWILKWFRAALALSPSFFSDQKNVFM